MSQPSLFDLTGQSLLLHSQINEIAELLFSENTEEAEQARCQLESLIAAESDNRKAVEAKADAWCWVIDHFRARAAAQAEHAQRLKNLAAEAEQRADLLQARLVAALSRIDPQATTWNLPEHRLTSRKSTAVELDPDLEPADLPDKYRRTSTTYSADKAAIKVALASGLKVKGATLVRRRSWTIK
jgi:DNA repair exonuclease SbcCD ATPase subunit